MAKLVIMRSVASFGACAPIGLTVFKNEEGRAIDVMPSVEEDNVSWTIPDTPENRAAFSVNYEPSGLYSCEAIGVEAPKPFSVKAKGGNKTPPFAGTLHVAPNANASTNAAPPKGGSKSKAKAKGKK